MTHFYYRRLGVGVVFTLILTLFLVTPTWAGDPDTTVGGINPNHYVCLTEDNKVVDLENDAVTVSDDDTVTFDPDKTVDLNKLKDECKDEEDERDEDLKVDVARQSRLEGYVFEFHPDPSAPGGWLGVRSQDVPVVITGPGFEVFKGSDKDGSFYFDNLGAGPVTFNLRLPADAHALNPNITVWTDGFLTVTSGIYLAFYRGDMPPPDLEAIQSPDGVPLPPANFTFENVDGSGTFSLNELTGMPSVGGVLAKQPSIFTIGLALVIVVALPIVGILKLRRARSDN
jgi:hypothetical protein